MINKEVLAKINPADKEQLKGIAMEVLRQAQKEGKTLQEVLGMSEGFLEQIYGVAYTFYNAGRYKEAISLFNLLVGAVPGRHKFTYGLAAAYRQTKEYGKAALGFFLAAHEDPENPYSAYYLADCLLKLEKIEEAKEALELTIETAGSHKEYQVLKERSILLKKTL